MPCILHLFCCRGHNGTQSRASFLKWIKTQEMIMWPEKQWIVTSMAATPLESLCRDVKYLLQPSVALRDFPVPPLTKLGC